MMMWDMWKVWKTMKAADADLLKINNNIVVAMEKIIIISIEGVIQRVTLTFLQFAFFVPSLLGFYSDHFTSIL